MTHDELKAWEDELNEHAKEIQQREHALQIAEHNQREAEEANRYDLFFGACNAKHDARPIAAVILEPQPVRQEVCRADLVAVASMIMSIGAVAAAVVSLMI